MKKFIIVIVLCIYSVSFGKIGDNTTNLRATITELATLNRILTLENAKLKLEIAKLKHINKKLTVINNNNIKKVVPKTKPVVARPKVIVKELPKPKTWLDRLESDIYKSHSMVVPNNLYIKHAIRVENLTSLKTLKVTFGILKSQLAIESGNYQKMVDQNLLNKSYKASLAYSNVELYKKSEEIKNIKQLLHNNEQLLMILINNRGKYIISFKNGKLFITTDRPVFKKLEYYTVEGYIVGSYFRIKTGSIVIHNTLGQ